MPLSDLPGELILSIADQLDIAGISTLSRTSSLFYSLLNEYLYRRDLTQAPEISRSLLHGDLELTVPRAIAAGQHLDPLPESYDFALGVAAYGGPGRVHLVEQLLKVRGINPNTMNDNEGNTLESAANMGETDIVKLLLDHPDINPNFLERNAHGQSALMRTTMPEVARLLLDRNDINVNLQDNEGWTALIWACWYNNASMVNLLLEREDVDPNIRTMRGHTALTLSCILSPTSRVDIVRLLLSRRDTDPNPIVPIGLLNLHHGNFRLLDRVIRNVTPHFGEEIESLLRAAGAR